ncbi:MAG: GNAT family N-acetyltransferase [Crocinitomicaceae bacterium]
MKRKVNGIDFKKDFDLENERVLLRPLKQTDFVLLEHFALNEPELWQYSLVSGASSKKLKAYIEQAIAERNANLAYPFLVIDKKTNEVAGSTRFYDYQPKHNTIQLGYTWYGQKFQGTGLNQNCKCLLLSFAFEKWKLDRVEFRADNNNQKSIRAMKNIGCKQEGVLRSNCADFDGGRRDSIVLSILKNEWFSEVKEILQSKK